MPDQTLTGTTLHLIARFLIDETQEVASTMTDGAFTLRAGASQTRPIPWDASWQDVEDALTALPAISRGGVTCTGGPLPAHPLRIRFTGRVGKHTQPPLEVVSGDVTVTTVEDGGPITLDTAPTITVNGPRGLTITPDTVDDLGGGAYQAAVTPMVAGRWTWTATGSATGHGDVTARGEFTVA